MGKRVIPTSSPNTLRTTTNLQTRLQPVTKRAFFKPALKDTLRRRVEVPRIAQDGLLIDVDSSTRQQYCNTPTSKQEYSALYNGRSPPPRPGNLVCRIASESAPYVRSL
jgi:hypothetical protein